VEEETVLAGVVEVVKGWRWRVQCLKAVVEFRWDSQFLPCCEEPEL
jgi:hypothetical protein